MTTKHIIHIKQLELSKDSVILNAEGFSMEMQMQDNDRMNVVYNYASQGSFRKIYTTSKC
jgi:hypothetical protein